jgi:hypothetical protein
MAISFRPHGTRNLVILTSRLRELIDELPKLHQSLDLDDCLRAHDDHGAGGWIEHPDRDDNSQFRIVDV